MRSHRVLRLAAACLLMALAAASCNKSLGSETVGPHNEQAGGFALKVIAPQKRETVEPIAGTDLDGRRVSLAGARGSVVVVNLWASWCPPCRNEEAVLQRVYDTYKTRGVRFLGIDIKDTLVNARAFRDEFKIRYPSIFNDSGSMAAAFRPAVREPPSTIVLDTKGRIAARIVGAVAKATELTPLIDQVLAE